MATFSHFLLQLVASLDTNDILLPYFNTVLQSCSAFASYSTICIITTTLILFLNNFRDCAKVHRAKTLARVQAILTLVCCFPLVLVVIVLHNFGHNFLTTYGSVAISVLAPFLATLAILCFTLCNWQKSKNCNVQRHLYLILGLSVVFLLVQSPSVTLGMYQLAQPESGVEDWPVFLRITKQIVQLSQVLHPLFFALTVGYYTNTEKMPTNLILDRGLAESLRGPDPLGVQLRDLDPQSRLLLGFGGQNHCHVVVF